MQIGMQHLRVALGTRLKALESVYSPSFHAEAPQYDQFDLLEVIFSRMHTARMSTNLLDEANHNPLVLLLQYPVLMVIVQALRAPLWSLSDRS
jgi:hypothetical protein